MSSVCHAHENLHWGRQPKSMMKIQIIPQTTTAKKLPQGQHPGFQNLKAQAAVYRCKLWQVINKRDPNHADYKGVLQLTGSKASVLVWVHADGSLGLRLEKITNHTHHQSKS